MIRSPDYTILLPFLVSLYGETAGEEAFKELVRRLEAFHTLHQASLHRVVPRLSEKDAFLISYADQVTQTGIQPLASLSTFSGRYLEGVVSGLHILPFFPSTSDDGFAVADYTSVDPGLGTWEEIESLAHRFRLMVDGVINHTSSHHAWFRAFLQGDPHYANYYITVPPETDLSAVVRPRALPLLTRFESAAGPQQIWTTFSVDQADLNYQNPKVLLDITELLLQYAAHGVQWLRLDAIAYLWKQPGTACIHLPQTHTVIRFWRGVFDLLAPYIMLVTETNVPHRENLSYFGGGQGEAQLVYNFALPPLVLHTFLKGDATVLSAWADGLSVPSDRVTLFNFLASHDGIGLNPVRGILPEAEIDRMVEAAVQRGGLLGRKSNPGGGESIYELNINYFDALTPPGPPDMLEREVDRLVAAHAVMLALRGVPGIYFHSLFGSRGWSEGVPFTRQNRTINRQKCTEPALSEEIDRSHSRRGQVYRRMVTLLRARSGLPAFDPYTHQRVIHAGQAAFALLRGGEGQSQPVLCITNVTGEEQTAYPEINATGLPSAWVDQISGVIVDLGASGQLRLAPYQVLWLIPR